MAVEVTTNLGKPITQSREEINHAIQKAKIIMELSENAFDEEIVYQENGITKKTMLEPIGLVLALLPSDSPVLETVNRLVPAILAGNAILLKSSTDTPLISKHFENAFNEKAPGLAQDFFINTEDARKIYSHKQVRLVNFSGSHTSALDVYFGEHDRGQ